jgi:hypothetical protein
MVYFLLKQSPEAYPGFTELSFNTRPIDLPVSPKDFPLLFTLMRMRSLILTTSVANGLAHIRDTRGTR